MELNLKAYVMLHMYSTCMYFGLFPGNMCRGHGDSLLRQVLSPKTVVNVV